MAFRRLILPFLVVLQSQESSLALSDPEMSPGCIKNFRQAFGVPFLFRAASLDGLGSVTEPSDPVERLVMQDCGLILDLRSDSERNRPLLDAWTSSCGVQVQRDVFSTERPQQRILLQLEPLAPTAFMEYVESAWFSPAEKTKAGFYKVFDMNKLHILRVKKLNERGLAGLNEAILESGKDVLKQGLEALTLHRENALSSPAIVHCVQGKDRTGIFCILCQSMMGLSDADMIDDYHRSHELWIREASAAEKLVEPEPGRIDKRSFAGAPRASMEQTLQYLRTKYGSIEEGYLENIGFTRAWRRRFVDAHLCAKSKL